MLGLLAQHGVFWTASPVSLMYVPERRVKVFNILITFFFFFNLILLRSKCCKSESCVIPVLASPGMTFMSYMEVTL